LIEKWLKVKEHLGSTNADILRWLFSNSATQIAAIFIAEPSAPEVPPSPRIERVEEVLRNAVEDEDDGLSDLDVDPDVVYATSTDPSSTELSDSDNQTIRTFEYGGQQDDKEEELVPDSEEFVPQGLAQYGYVAREKLANLFAIFKVKCPQPNCLLYCEEPVIHDLRMCYSVSFTCVAGHAFPWISGNLETTWHSPEIVPRLYSAILCVGLSYTQLREICLALGLYTPGSSHFYEFQRRADRRIG
jgi:hypothetical protein